MMARIYFPPELHVMVPCWRRRVGPWHLFFFVSWVNMCVLLCWGDVFELVLLARHAWCWYEAVDMGLE